MNSNLAVEQNSNSNSNTNTPNLIGLFIDKPSVEINKFIHRDKSEHTIETYRNHFKHVFMYMCGKSIDDLTWTDIQNITISKVKDYRNTLDGVFANSTINQRILATKALWDDFFENEKVAKNVFDIKKIKQKKNPYDSLTDREITLLFEYCLEEDFKPHTKQLYFEFLYNTGLRKNIVRSITIQDIKRKLDFKTQQEFWVIDMEDKCKDREVAITNNFYNRLIENYEREGILDNKLFHIHNHTMDDVLKAFCEKYNITRHIVQHSVKSSSGDLVQNVFNDLQKTAKHLGHSNIQTTFEHYTGKNESYSEQPSILLNQDYSINMLKGLGEDVLIGLIEKYTEKYGRDLIIKLCIEINGLAENK